MYASAKTLATDTTSNWSVWSCACSFSGMVSVTKTFSSGDARILSTAGPERTGCVEAARTLEAPWSMTAWAALVSVPAVSIMSSIKTATFPSTSPLNASPDTFGPSRRLSMMARPQRNFWHRLLLFQHHLHQEIPRNVFLNTRKVVCTRDELAVWI